jgi:hypothetical protein
MATCRRRSPKSAKRRVARKDSSAIDRVAARERLLTDSVQTVGVLDHEVESIEAFDRVWRRVRDDAARLFPQGVSEANVHLAFEPSGRRTVSIQVRGREPLAGREAGLVELPIEPPPVSIPAAVDLAWPLPEKVAALWDILGAVVSDLDAASTAARKRVVRTFLLHLAGHESQLRTRRQNAGGPARSLFQFEAHRAKDAGLHARALGLLGKLAAIAGSATAELTAAFDALPAFNAQHPAQSAFFPASSPIAARLLDNDLFAAYLIRIDFRRFAAPVPESVEAQAEYWLRFWKGSAANPAEAKRQFVANCARIDPHIPS